jgi:hypothetical protein
MGSIVFSQPSIRSSTALNWVSPVQAVFAFFAPPQIKVHAVPNQIRIDLADGKPAKPANHPKLPEAHVVRSKFDDAGFSAESLTEPRQLKARPRAASSLKVLREFEPGRSRSSTGRLVISGRMADVCEMLDRMATQNASTR